MSTTKPNAKELYQEFLASVFWADIRSACINRDGGYCRHCGDSRRLQAHHVTYLADWYQTTLDQLITLCRKCHEVEHGIKVKLKHKKQAKPQVKWWPGIYEGKPKPEHLMSKKEKKRARRALRKAKRSVNQVIKQWKPATIFGRQTQVDTPARTT